MDAKKPIDPAKEQEKEFKKLLDSFVLVAKHKLNRQPTLDELGSMFGGQDDPMVAATQPTAGTVPQGQPAGGAVPESAAKATGEMVDAAQGKADEEGPKLLKVRIFYGMSGDEGQKKPDPKQVLFYEHPQGGWYDCQAGKWADQRPPVLDHLPSRPIMADENDMVNAISHGIVDDDDHAQLKKAGLMGDVPSRLFDLHKKLTEKKEQLTKSTETEAPETEDGDEKADQPDVAPATSNGALSTVLAGVEADPSTEGELPGEDVLTPLIEACFAAVGDANEDMIRRIVRDELARFGLVDHTEPDGDEDVGDESAAEKQIEDATGAPDDEDLEKQTDPQTAAPPPEAATQKTPM